MTVIEEIVSALFHPSVITNVTRMFNSNFVHNGHKDRMPLDLYDMSFRLYKPTPDFVNFEFNTSCQLGSFFQPVAIIDKQLQFFIINEFVLTYLDLNKKGHIRNKAQSLNLELNAIIGAFSASSLEVVIEIFNDFKAKGNDIEFVKIGGNTLAKRPNYDRFFESNGYKAELIFCNKNYPQFYLDSEYGISDVICAYIENNGQINFHPTAAYKENADLLRKLNLLTAFDIY